MQTQKALSRVSYLMPLILVVALAAYGVESTSAEAPATRDGTTYMGALEASPGGVTESGLRGPSAFRQGAPLLFIENVGQFPEDAVFQVHGAGGTAVWLARDAIWLTLLEPPPLPPADPRLRDSLKPRIPTPRQGVHIKLSFVGANPNPHLEPVGQLETSVNYFQGNDPGRWHSNVPVWGGVRYVDLYPGVDVELDSEAGQWRWRLVDRHPGARLQDVQLRVEGAAEVALDGNMLNLSTDLGELRLPLLDIESSEPLVQPAVEQAPGGAPIVSEPFARSTHDAASVATGDDPGTLLFSTFVGGSAYEDCEALVVDKDMNAYCSARTESSDFPSTPGAYDTTYNAGSDAYVFRLSADGSSLHFLTYVGGNGYDMAEAMALDSTGNIVVTGHTSSHDFPTSPTAYDVGYNGEGDAFAFMLSEDGGSLLYGTYLGGGGPDAGRGLALDGQGNAVVTGGTESADFPTTPSAYDASHNGGEDLFVLKLSADGSALLQSTYIGGTRAERGWSVALEDTGAAVIAGHTSSPDFPATPGAYDTTYNGYDDMFIVKISADASSLLYGTFVGGSDDDGAFAVALNGEGRAVAAGFSESLNFPTTPGAYDSSHNGSVDLIVCTLSADGDSLVSSTYAGGTDWDSGLGLALDVDGNALVAGDTYSADFPTTLGAYDTSHNGKQDVFLLGLSPDAGSLLYSTFLGGGWYEFGREVALDAPGSAVVAGHTASADFPTTSGAYDTSINASVDVFVSKLSLCYVPAAPVLASPPEGYSSCATPSTFKWAAATDAAEYQLQIDDDPAFVTPAIDVSTGEALYAGALPLPAGVYYWRVRAKNDCGNSTWSSIWTFEVRARPEFPKLSEPGDEDSLCNSSPLFGWKPTDGATEYRIQVATDRDFTTRVINKSTSGTSYTPRDALPPGSYHWRVQAANACGDSPWSPPWQFTILTTPGATALASPPDGGESCETTPTLAWSPLDGAASYRIQVAADPDFASVTIEATTPETSLVPATALATGTYYWRVQAANECGDGPWSPVWALTVNQPPVAPALSSPPDGESSCDPGPAFTWLPVAEATSYAIQVDTSVSFDTAVISDTTTSPTFTPTESLSPSTYYWHVRSANECGPGAWSMAWRFRCMGCLYLPLALRQ